MTINEMKLLALQAEWEAISKNTMGGKYDKAYQNGVHNVGRRIREMIDEFEQEEKNKLRKIGETSQEQMWIPVSERLPEERNYYLVTIEIDGRGLKPYHGIRVSWYSDKQFVGEYIGDGLVAKKSVIAWMPLPQPYVESEDKE